MHCRCFDIGGALADTVGSIFLMGHDPDFHTFLGGNAIGAQHINQTAINFIMDPTFNPFVAGGDLAFSVRRVRHVQRAGRSRGWIIGNYR